MPSLRLAPPTSFSSKSVLLQCALPVVSPPVLPEAPTPNTDRTRVLDNFADALFVQGRLDRVGAALASVQGDSKSAHKYKSKHFYFPARALALVQSTAWLCRAAGWLAGPRRAVACLLPAARGLKPEQAVWVATGDVSLDEAAAEDCAVVEASGLTRSRAHCLRRPPAAPRGSSLESTG
jgi:hypothetical protein